MPSIKDWVLLLFGFDWLNVILTMTGFSFVGLLMYWQLKRGDGFDLRMMCADQVEHGKWTVRPGKVFQTGAFGITTWLTIWLTQHDKMTEAYLFVYCGLWASSPIFNRMAASKFPVAGEQAPPPLMDPPDEVSASKPKRKSR